MSGSSPLTRGAPATVVTRRHETRLIPADAGSTNDPSHIHPSKGAHPR